MGLDPLSQMRDKKTPPNPSNQEKSVFSKKTEIDRVIEFDKFSKNRNKEEFLDFSPLKNTPHNSEEIKSEEPLKNAIPKPLYAAFKDMKTFGFSNDEKLPGEIVLETADSSIILNSSMCDGKLILTNFKLHFRPIRSEFYQSYQLRPEFFQMPIMSIEKFGKYPEKKTNYLYLDLQTKDIRLFKFRIPSENFKEGERVFSLLEAFLTKKKKDHTAIDFAQNFKNLDTTYKGWEIYDILKEFAREKADIEIRRDQEKADLIGALRLCDNSTGHICSTYPEYFVVPNKASEELIYKSSKFRTKERVPALTYCYRQIVNGIITRTYLWRSSQCKVFHFMYFKNKLMGFFM